VTVILEAEGLTKLYPTDAGCVRAVDEVALRVEAGEQVSIMGPSGCGKSTLLHLLGGLDRADAGRVVIAGEMITGRSESDLARLRRRSIGFVFQAFHLVDELTAVENVELPVLLIGERPSIARRRAMEQLEQLGVADRASHLPHRMSGGQRQRVAIARALVNSPVILLADEPTGNLDSQASGELLELLGGLGNAGQALLVATHDPRVATVADRLLTMRDGAILDETRLDAGATRSVLSGLVGFDG
jgi:putative ABC transport system ATP-binding protein